MSRPGRCPTADRDALHAACAHSNAKLDGALPISAYLRLTEASGKALFLMAEMRAQ